MMKGLTLAVIAMCAASAHARVVILAAEAAFHTDSWCQDHHSGEGPATCIMNSGCCYDGRIGKCHSCDAHSDDWCGAYGGSDAKVCVGFAGCTMEYADGPDKPGMCISNTDESLINDDVTCEMMMVAMTGCAEQGAEAFCFGKFEPGCEHPHGEAVKWQCSPIPQCTADGEFEPEQRDSDDFVWCVSDAGHTIPDTRMKEKQFAASLMNCAKERKKHKGMQCPNAVTLSTGNGEVMINDHEDVGNCDMRCNTDKDCGDEEWCCYNGCGYSCQVPIVPKADCATLILDDSLDATDFELVGSHGTKVMISCKEGYGGSDSVEIECKHGDWSHEEPYSMDCKKNCPEYEIFDERKRDYVLTGKSVIHDAKRKVECTNGYGAVAGSPDAMRFYKEVLRCVNGAWEERTLKCSSCFDAPSEGPHAFWTGRLTEYQIVDHDGDEGSPSAVDGSINPLRTPMPENAPLDTAIRDPEGNIIEPHGGFTTRVRKVVDVGTERKDSFDCLYFASRPMKCGEFTDARNECRISCRTCEQALMKYKVKAILDVKDDTRHPEKWLKRKLRLLSHFKNLITDQRRVKVAKRVKKTDDYRM